VAQRGERLLRLGVEQPAGLGGRGAEPAALEDSDSKAPLEREDPLAGRGLRESQGFGGGGQAA
jgi:hypothetical protein